MLVFVTRGHWMPCSLWEQLWMNCLSLCLSQSHPANPGRLRPRESWNRWAPNECGIQVSGSCCSLGLAMAYTETFPSMCGQAIPIDLLSGVLAFVLSAIFPLCGRQMHSVFWGFTLDPWPVGQEPLLHLAFTCLIPSGEPCSLTRTTTLQKSWSPISPAWNPFLLEMDLNLVPILWTLTTSLPPLQDPIHFPSLSPSPFLHLSPLFCV